MIDIQDSDDSGNANVIIPLPQSISFDVLCRGSTYTLVLYRLGETMPFATVYVNNKVELDFWTQIVQDANERLKKESLL